ncbi:hypothetical protein IST4116A_01245 [Burkholderia cenocepacia]|nr:hypothetical protein IST4116B_01237 [Burkholderia cenocepacia]CAB5084150.1 hypothetical protein IST4134_01246 [Burkholderia cenocepacia]CAB5088188.1 hypothetical protein IST4113_01244 [Burkholderia cenocepacia]CAB5096250.1 hypothetical protein IST439_01284 [Burkholderia cenocepacia]CAB5105719.1 hypothetical protein IST4129_01245 [Burkholderia cenocepacia]
MLLGILRMPDDSIAGDCAGFMQFVSAARGAADRIEADAKIINELRAALEAAAADKVDADRWRAVRDTLSGAVGAGIEVNDERLVYQDPVPGEEVRIFWYPYTPIGFTEIHGTTLDEAADALISQRQEES